MASPTLISIADMFRYSKNNLSSANLIFISTVHTLWMLFLTPNSVWMWNLPLAFTCCAWPAWFIPLHLINADQLCSHGMFLQAEMRTFLSKPMTQSCCFFKIFFLSMKNNQCPVQLLEIHSRVHVHTFNKMFFCFFLIYNQLLISIIAN